MRRGEEGRGYSDYEGLSSNGNDVRSEDSTRILLELHRMMKSVLTALNIPVSTEIEEGEQPKRVRKLKSKLMSAVATPSARGIEAVVTYMSKAIPTIVQDILR